MKNKDGTLNREKVGKMAASLLARHDQATEDFNRKVLEDIPVMLEALATFGRVVDKDNPTDYIREFSSKTLDTLAIAGFFYLNGLLLSEGGSIVDRLEKP